MSTNSRNAEASPLAPLSIRRAAGFLTAAATLSAAASVAAWSGLRLLPPGSSHAPGVFSFFSLTLITWKIAAGRSWARTLFVVLYVLGMMGFVVALILVPGAFRELPPLGIANGVAQFALQTGALIFLFAAPSRQWFRGAGVRPGAR